MSLLRRFKHWLFGKPIETAGEAPDDMPVAKLANMIFSKVINEQANGFVIHEGQVLIDNRPGFSPPDALIPDLFTYLCSLSDEMSGQPVDGKYQGEITVRLNDDTCVFACCYHVENRCFAGDRKNHLGE